MGELTEKLGRTRQEKEDIQKSIALLDKDRVNLTSEIDELSRKHDEVQSKCKPN